MPPTTRHGRKAKDDTPEALLPGIPMDEKRLRVPKPPGLSRVSKPGVKKGKKKGQDQSLPHIALANDLLERGDELRLPEIPFQKFESPKVWGPRDVPITDPTKLPEGWSASETDLAEDDIDGQISRCHRRIEENIMPAIFEQRLEIYQKMKQKQTDMIKSEPKGLSWEVVQRLDCLEGVKKSFKELGGDNGNTPNLIAIMDAYRSGDLVWDDDLVTYWAHGKMVGGPKKMDMEEFYTLSRELGPNGVWVEGLDSFKPGHLYVFCTLPPFNPGWASHKIVISIRNPATSSTNTLAQTMHLPFLEDTGATTMTMYQSDRDALEGLSGLPLPFYGSTMMRTVNGSIPMDNLVVQVNIYANGHPMLPKWVNVRVGVSRVPPNTPPTAPRLSGVWIHHMLYCLSMPDNKLEMHVGNDLQEILGNVPLCDPAYAIPPPTSTLPPLPLAAPPHP
ncbi:uncharacterized protein N7500_004244 [Penicillium coprophilum]|uniref:uncharacterized protein n=1 Tax=Penicillium coprophilum TaxID=36646 RepID=UPI0023944863|nr:uncharacterized protein N7500_004244 [Penicillium coprophilum]KAJ5171461.1 hypothetical protein N7500_004244 [Penicillium coprophilum]